ncbi:hypothetical protein MCHLDSM_03008 [Mycolicibacterium chlorophenolicum]|uniref:PPE family protein PPE42 n=2 Tax=Mycolicibacterium chlorophenolicum TaxID=37916 RepID=A0A0J6W376_9MYCO|nr:hypothetical protein MCHLDSM_03008 [Mycolicibacterium chlorophenolicum]
MQAAALRPFVTAGVSLVAAGMVAISPVTPPPAPLSVVSTAVQLTAAPAPLAFYPKVAGEALINIVTSIGSYPAVAPLFIDEFLVHPGQVLESVIGNSTRLLFHAVQSVISPFANVLGATLVALRDVAVAALNLDPVDLFNAVVDIPARVTDGFLNGGYPVLGSLEAGLLSPPVIDFYYVGVGGPLSFPPFAALYVLLNDPPAAISPDVEPAATETAAAGRLAKEPTTTDADSPVGGVTSDPATVDPAADSAEGTAVAEGAVSDLQETDLSVGNDHTPTTRPGSFFERMHRRIAARQEARAERRLAHAASAKRQTPRTAEPTAP